MRPNTLSEESKKSQKSPFLCQSSIFPKKKQCMRKKNFSVPFHPSLKGTEFENCLHFCEVFSYHYTVLYIFMLFILNVYLILSRYYENVMELILYKLINVVNM